VKFTGDVAGFRKLNSGHLTKNEAPRLAADLILKNPRPPSAGAQANAEAWDVVVEYDAVGHAPVEL
jgi:hypothetical protein